MYKQISIHHAQYVFVTENQELHSIARNEVIAKAVLVEINISIALYIFFFNCFDGRFELDL